ncbi:hypothetical protein [Halocatena salina]|uniref:Uncharacterized protein n=1 Tax=Halocatena salina TaxID=2934340 RepID=A0A8U0A626_9EURY|nr:hypothetical protein [Halocatena salina]UPM44631.1 hypothetical protein MW046_16440 [Halocatena salina]
MNHTDDRLGRQNGLALGAALVSVTYTGFTVADSIYWVPPQLQEGR